MERQIDIGKMRKRSGLNQRDFWTRVGVTQSGGSRYEGGRPMPRPVRLLVTIAYGTEAEVRRAVLALNENVVVISQKRPRRPSRT